MEGRGEAGMGKGRAGSVTEKTFRPRNSRSPGAPAAWLTKTKTLFRAAANCSGCGEPRRKRDGGDWNRAAAPARGAFSYVIISSPRFPIRFLLTSKLGSFSLAAVLAVSRMKLRPLIDCGDISASIFSSVVQAFWQSKRQRRNF